MFGVETFVVNGKSATLRKSYNKPEFWAAMKNHVEEMRFEVRF